MIKFQINNSIIPIYFGKIYIVRYKFNYFFRTNQYATVIDPNVWNEYQKENPDPKKFYVSEVFELSISFFLNISR